MAYPYSKAETTADGAVHVAGLVFALPACALLIQQAGHSGVTLTACALYALCLTFSLSASAIYHLSPNERLRPLLHRIDHAAIYLKIAGTYTPLVVVIGTGFAFGILGVVWALALIGAVAKLWFWNTNGKGSLTLYLGMGWLSVLLIWPMWTYLPPAAVALIVTGGLIYSAATLIYAHPGMRYQNALWHVAVLIASIAFFAAITLSISPG